MAPKKKQRGHKELVNLIDKGVAKGRSLTAEHLDHSETLRATALGQAIGYYINTIVKDGDLYREMVRDNRVLKPATYMGVIEVAMSFEAYLSGELQKDAESISSILKGLQPIKDVKVDAERDAETVTDSLGNPNG